MSLGASACLWSELEGSWAPPIVSRTTSDGTPGNGDWYVLLCDETPFSLVCKLDNVAELGRATPELPKENWGAVFGASTGLAEVVDDSWDMDGLEDSADEREGTWGGKKDCSFGAVLAVSPGRERVGWRANVDALSADLVIREAGDCDAPGRLVKGFSRVVCEKKPPPNC
jgi:hypothetical protein